MERLIFTFLVAVSVIGCIEGEPSTPSKLQVETTDRINSEIEVLASKNTPPSITGALDDQRLRFEPSYNWDMQVPVYLAIQQLLGEGEAGVNLLLSHTDDKRYSFTMFSVGPTNVQVSRACFLIARMQVLCFESETTYFSADQRALYPDFLTLEKFSEWWEKNKQRGLATLQLEAIDKMLAYTRTADWNKARGRYMSEGRDDAEFFNRSRDKNIPILDSIRAEIIAGKSPHRPTAVATIDWGCRMIGLPWTKGPW